MFLEMPLGGIELGFVETWETWGRFLNRIEGFRGLPEDSTAGLANFGDQFQLSSGSAIVMLPISLPKTSYIFYWPKSLRRITRT